MPRFLNLIGTFFLAATLPGADFPGESEWVRPGPDGKLQYKTTSRGDRILDFSHAGYMGGGTAIPDVPAQRTVQPSGADDSAAIQKAIEEVAALDLVNGFRGAVLLSPGTFSCSNTLVITASGVVLRGSGSAPDDPNRTTIRLRGVPHTGISVHSPRTAPENAANITEGPSTAITDSYVPSGAVSFNVKDASRFASGDRIEIRKPVTEAWIKFMKMDDLVRDGRKQTWIRPGQVITFERRIAQISGNTITVGVPLPDSLDARFLGPSGATVRKLEPHQRVEQVGIENLHIKSPPQPFNHSRPHFSAIRINAQDSWMRNVMAEETMNSIGITGRRITAQNVSVIRRARHEGSSRPASFAPNGSQILLDRCSGVADNVWYVATGGGVTGSTVLLNCTFEGDGRIESHQRWSVGVLYDNCKVPGGGIDFRNRGSMGSGHGWSMGWGVAWNCEAKNFVIQNPPGAMNWMIGCIGESKPAPRPFATSPALPEGTKDSHGAHVSPGSLYLAQLKERLGSEALKKIGY